MTLPGALAALLTRLAIAPEPVLWEEPARCRPIAKPPSALSLTRLSSAGVGPSCANRRTSSRKVVIASAARSGAVPMLTEKWPTSQPSWLSAETWYARPRRSRSSTNRRPPCPPKAEAARPKASASGSPRRAPGQPSQSHACSRSEDTRER